MNIKKVRFGRYLGLKHEDTLERAGKAGRLQAERASSREDPKSFEKHFKKLREHPRKQGRGRAGKQSRKKGQAEQARKAGQAEQAEQAAQASGQGNRRRDLWISSDVTLSEEPFKEVNLL